MSNPIADARIALQAGLMRDSGTIVRPVLLDDGAGGQYPDPSGPTEINVPACAFSRLTGRELEAAAQLQQRGSYRLALPIDTDIQAADQFRYSGVIYNVVWAPPLTALNLSRVVGLEEATS
jgi:Phage head-tail joining protein